MKKEDMGSQSWFKISAVSMTQGKPGNDAEGLQDQAFARFWN
jgi:hypothetical protein